MYKLSVQNEAGELLELTNNKNYSVIRIDGLNPPSATINTSTVTNFDGARYNSSRVNMRNLVITILPEYPVDVNRIALYRYFKSKQKCRIYYENRIRKVYIDGYVETMESNPFERRQQMQISIICPQPYFIDMTDTRLDDIRVIPLFEAPFSIPAEGMEFSEYLPDSPIEFVNNGDIESGIIFDFSFRGNVVELTIIDDITLKYFVVEYEFKAYDRLIINTNKGEKSIILSREGKDINLVNYITENSEWFTAHIGLNTFKLSAVAGIENFDVTATWLTLYEGV